MTTRLVLGLAAGLLALAAASVGTAQSSADGRVPDGWLSWRGPDQNGTSRETDLPEQVVLAPGRAWTYRLKGRGTPVVAAGRVFTMGYEGEGRALQEMLVCFDATTGKRLWEHRFTDFLTDIIYHRFSIGSPTIDPETGNVLCLSAAGLLSCFGRDGALLWQHSMMSEYGRLTFPNGRTGAPVVDGELAIVHVATSGWGPQGPARDRFFAFDKKTGEPIWSSTPGGPPKDTSFSYPVLAHEHGRRVMYAGLAGGYMVCVDVRTGDPIWRFQMSVGGVSSSPVLHGESVIAIHGKENTDSSVIGRMVAIRRGAQPEGGKGPVELGRASELWRNNLTAFTSSPVLVEDRVYQTVHTGELCCIDVTTGKVLWHQKLAPDQIHASPAWGDGKLYVPMNNGTFFIVRPSDEAGQVLQKVQLEGNCLGAPAIAGGRIYLHTTERLYCFGGAPAVSGDTAAVRLQLIPGDVLLQQGETRPCRVRSLDAVGRVVGPSVPGVTWHVPFKGVTVHQGVLAVAPDATPGVGVLGAEALGLRATARVRIVPRIPFSDDFEDVVLGPHPTEPGVQFAAARPYWLAVTKRWEIRELDGSKVLARTLEPPLFQRTMSLIGHPDMKDYTMQADIWADGNRRIMAAGGLVNQRYLIILKGNHQEIEVSSNMELLRETVPFQWKAKTWYRLKTRVDVEPDGSGTVRAKAWPRDQKEPEAWNIEVAHPNAHTQGSPGLYGFTPQSRLRVYLDNISVTPNG